MQKFGKQMKKNGIYLLSLPTLFFLVLSKETFSNSKPSKDMVNVQRFHSMGKNHYTKNSWFSVFFPKKQTQFPIQSHSAKFIFEEGVKNRLA